MYFKQRENSPLYQHYQKLEQQRLSKKLEEIRAQKVRSRDSVERLPPITHRPSDAKIYQKQMVLAETDRLNKKIRELKNSRSAYFSKVIGLNLSMDLARSRKTPKMSAKDPNHSSVVQTTHSQES